MNRCWQERLVATLPGGSGGGGAGVTPFGRQVLQHYRAIQCRTGDWAALELLLLPAPRISQKD